MPSISHYVIQNRIDHRYIAGRNVPGDPYRMVEDVDRALKCPNEVDAEGHMQAYIVHCRRDGRRTVPTKSVYKIIAVYEKPPPPTFWERL